MADRKEAGAELALAPYSATLQQAIYDFVFPQDEL